MNTNLPLPERTLPPDSADRIRATIMADGSELGARRARTWLLPLAAVLVVIALVATAVVLWPRTSRTEIASTPSASPSAAATTAEPAPTAPPSPTPAPSRTGPLAPGPKQKPLDTDRGALTTKKARALINECNAPTDGVDPPTFAIEKIPYARRVTDGEKALEVTIFRMGNGQEWFCAPASGYLTLDQYGPDIGPNWSFPVVGALQTIGTGNYRATAEWSFRALSPVDRIQVRAVVKGKPERWFEGKVQGGFAFVPVVTRGKFRINPETAGFEGLSFEHRAFDTDGREVPVRIMEQPR